MATENGGGGAGVESPLPPTARAKPDYYGILGVEKDCTEAQLKKAYKKMSLKLHPDKNQDDPDAQHKFAILSEAYTCLLDPVKRIDYNKEIAEGGTVGWGWNAETARKRAADYKWNGDDMVFNMGAQLNQARQFRDFRHQRFATQVMWTTI
ncbi:DnaJ domain-containing protein [Baffinella frigidus]|nr:DnaJ domain-containing protein [Cryptophyta sp. CCMP2293]